MSIKRAAASIVLCACACLCLCFPPSPAEAAAPCLWERVQTASFASELIIDLAVSPLYAQDGTLFALTFQNGSHYLWRTQDGALTWQKIAFSGGCCWDRIELSPDYGQAARVAYILGSGESGAMLWYSADAGNNWLVRPLPEGTGSPSPIVVASDGSLFVAGYDGLSGRSFVCYSADAGNNFTAGGTLGTVPAYSLAVSRSYGQAVLLAGDTWGGAWLSSNNAGSFQPVNMGQLTGRVSVAFDNRFGDNYTAYAACNDESGGIYRACIGSGTPWQRLDGGVDGGGLTGSLKVSPAGLLYAASSLAVNPSQGGLLRCLDPADDDWLCRRVYDGLPDGTVLREGILECSGSRLWAVDSAGNYLLTFEDTLSEPVKLFSPADGACGAGTISEGRAGGITLGWQPLNGAQTYEWQLSPTTDFSAVPIGFSGNTGDIGAALAGLACDRDYFWRVRVLAPLVSPWSETWSFRTAPLPVKPGVPRLIAPLHTGEGMMPEFRWEAATGADAYELVVSGNMDMSSPVISKTGAQCISACYWRCDITLDYGTPYYWRVRAAAGSQFGDWSDKGVFVTMPESSDVAPAATAPPPPEAPLLPLPAANGTTAATTASVTATAAPYAYTHPVIAPQTEEAQSGWLWYALAAGALLVGAVLLLAKSRKMR